MNAPETHWGNVWDSIKHSEVVCDTCGQILLAFCVGATLKGRLLKWRLTCYNYITNQNNILHFLVFPIPLFISYQNCATCSSSTFIFTLVKSYSITELACSWSLSLTHMDNRPVHQSQEEYGLSPSLWSMYGLSFWEQYFFSLSDFVSLSLKPLPFLLNSLCSHTHFLSSFSELCLQSDIYIF